MLLFTSASHILLSMRNRYWDCIFQKGY